MKTSSLLFGCCSDFEGLNAQESHNRSFIRNGISKFKKTNLASLANSPKSSLKTVASMKSFNHNENRHASNSVIKNSEESKRSKLTFAGEMPVTHYLKKMDKFLNPCCSQQQKSNYLSPKELNTQITSMKSNIKFSYNNIKNPEKEKETSATFYDQQGKRNELNKIKTSNVKPNFTMIANHSQSNNNEKVNSKTNLSEGRKSIESMPSLRESIMELGDSKFTIESRGEIEEAMMDKKVKMYESSIIVNVFNPTASQIKKWDAAAYNKKI